MPDVGRAPFPDLSAIEIVICEGMFMGVLALGSTIGRWSRRNTLVAYEELERRARAGIVHRDIKPTNLFRERDGGRWKILDFGVSRLAGVAVVLARHARDRHASAPDFAEALARAMRTT